MVLKYFSKYQKLQIRSISNPTVFRRNSSFNLATQTHTYCSKVHKVSQMITTKKNVHQSNMKNQALNTHIISFHPTLTSV